MNSLSIPKYSPKLKLISNITAPHAPNKCIGRRPNRVRNQMVIKSKNPLKNRSDPNFVSPCFRAWCCTTFSPMFEKPACLRSEEHTSELQSRGHLVCRLLLEKKKKISFYRIVLWLR